MPPNICMLALDVDGTLVDRQNRVAPEVREAVADAAAAGIRVCLATGRSYIETLGVWQQIPWPADRPVEPMALIGGAIVAEPQTGRTLYQQTIPRDLADTYARALVEAGYSALGIVDEWRWSVDYLTLPADDYDRVEKLWFAQMPDVKVRHVTSFNAEHPPALRVNALVESADAPALEARMVEQFGEQLNIHAILAPNYGVTIVEAFAREANKLSAIHYIAQGHRIGMGSVAAVGDDVNDLPMLKGVGLGVAMPQAPDHVRQAADIVATDGLAAFIRSLI